MGKHHSHVLRWWLDASEWLGAHLAGHYLEQ
jgi:hypothetical protein